MNILIEGSKEKGAELMYHFDDTQLMAFIWKHYSADWIIFSPQRIIEISRKESCWFGDNWLRIFND